MRSVSKSSFRQSQICIWKNNAAKCSRYYYPSYSVGGKQTIQDELQEAGEEVQASRPDKRQTGEGAA
jgi:hypothetical protein